VFTVVVGLDGSGLNGKSFQNSLLGFSMYFGSFFISGHFFRITFSIGFAGILNFALKLSQLLTLAHFSGKPISSLLALFTAKEKTKFC
jgi:hypothetical protein